MAAISTASAPAAAATAAVLYRAPAASLITAQIQAFRNKVEEVITTRQTPAYRTIEEAEITSQDSKDILADIRYVLQELKLPAAERDQKLELYDQTTHMPIAIHEDATPAEIAECDAIIARIEGSGADLSYTRGLASFQYLISKVTVARDHLTKIAAIRDSSVESLATRAVTPLEAVGLDALLSDLEQAQKKLSECAMGYEDGSRNIFTRDAEPTFLAVARETNEAALAAITALAPYINRLDDLSERVRTVRVRTVIENLEVNRAILNPPMPAAAARAAAAATPAGRFHGGGGADTFVSFGGGSTPGDGSAAFADDELDGAATPPVHHRPTGRFHGGGGGAGTFAAAHFGVEAVDVAYAALQDVFFALEHTPVGGRFEVRGTGPDMSWEKGIEIPVTADATSSAKLPAGEYEFKVVHISDEGRTTWSKGDNLNSTIFRSGEPVFIKF